MIKVHTRKYIGTPFSIEVTDIKNDPGIMDSAKVSVYRDDILIGEYIRNYNKYAALTFYPFKQGDVWYALYSAEYTKLRVMRLNAHSIEDWCEDEVPWYTPVEVFIPQFNQHGTTYTTDADAADDTTFVKHRLDAHFVRAEYCKFGFACVSAPGNDLWQINFIDLRDIADKQIRVTDLFGNWHMPPSLTLRQCISMTDWEPTNNSVNLVRFSTVDLTLYTED